jgi:hypothetical protein
MTALEAAGVIANALVSDGGWLNKISKGGHAFHEGFVHLAEPIIQQAVDDRGMSGHYVINGYSLRCINDAAPEEYDVYYAGEKVGWCAMRVGRFTAHASGLKIYEATPGGQDCFEDKQRMFYLTAAIAAINAHCITAKAIEESNRANTPVEVEELLDEMEIKENKTEGGMDPSSEPQE